MLIVNFEYIPFHLTFYLLVFQSFVVKERVIDLKHINIKLRQNRKRKIRGKVNKAPKIC